DGVLAGSLLTMIEAVRNLHALGVPLEDALTAATAVPARVIAEPNAGRLEVGLAADIVVLDDSLEIERVLLGGGARVVARARPGGRSPASSRRDLRARDPRAAGRPVESPRARSGIRRARPGDRGSSAHTDPVRRSRFVRQRGHVRRLRVWA